MNENLSGGSGWLLDVPTFVITDLTGFLDVDSFTGQNATIDGMPGEVADANTLVRAAFTFTVPFKLAGDTLPELYANIATLRALFPSPYLTLTRRREKTASPFYEDHTCNGQYLGLSWPEAGLDDMEAIDIGGLLTFRNLDGAWS